MSHIFISYSRRDTEIASKIAEYLRHHDIDVWTDKSIATGENWAVSIDKAIDEASACILILSLSSTNSTYVTQEYRRILGQNKRLYILKVDDIPVDEIHPSLLSMQYIDLTRDFDMGMQQLVSVIQQSTLLVGETLQEALSDEASDDLILEVDFQNADSEKVVDVIKGLLDRGVRSIRIKNG